MSYVEMPGAKVPIRMWADPTTVEDVAMRQLQNVATLPWIKGLAVMPDVHYGKGATVGSVIAMHGAVCPAAVGVDIGCGMSAVKTSLTANDLPGDLSRLRSRIEQAIPVGRGMHDEMVDPGKVFGLSAGGWDDLWDRFDTVADAVKFRRERATKQMGSLGGGNHFVEVCVDTSDSVWLMLHSGSRNIGKELAEYHIGEAQKLPHNQGLVDRDLAVFVSDTPQMAAYRNDRNEASFNSASHGAGRRMSRNAAKRRFSARDLEEQTRGVECRKDSGVVDEIPGAYKSIEQVIDQQRDLVEVVAKLKQVVCVKG